MYKKNKRQGRQAFSATTVSAAPTAGTNGNTDFNPDYSYVIKDLRRIGILAGSFVALLVVVSFLLR